MINYRCKYNYPCDDNNYNSYVDAVYAPKSSPVI